MGKSTWVIKVQFERFDEEWLWGIHNRKHPSIKFESCCLYARKDSAIRGAKRVAKALRINAEVEE